MFESFDPRTSSLNATNVGLGLLVLLCCLFLLRGFLEDLLDRLFHPNGDANSTEDHDTTRRQGTIRDSGTTAFPEEEEFDDRGRGGRSAGILNIPGGAARADKVNSVHK